MDPSCFLSGPQHKDANGHTAVPDTVISTLLGIASTGVIRSVLHIGYYEDHKKQSTSDVEVTYADASHADQTSGFDGLPVGGTVNVYSDVFSQYHKDAHAIPHSYGSHDDPTSRAKISHALSEIIKVKDFITRCLDHQTGGDIIVATWNFLPLAEYRSAPIEHAPVPPVITHFTSLVHEGYPFQFGTEDFTITYLSDQTALVVRAGQGFMDRWRHGFHSEGSSLEQSLKDYILSEAFAQGPGIRASPNFCQTLLKHGYVIKPKDQDQCEQGPEFLLDL